MSQFWYLIHSHKLPPESLYLEVCNEGCHLIFLTKQIPPTSDRLWQVTHPISGKVFQVQAFDIDNTTPRVKVEGVEIELETVLFNPRYSLVKNGTINASKLILKAAFVCFTTVLLYSVGIVGLLGVILAVVLTKVTNDSKGVPLWYRHCLNVIWWGALLFYWYHIEFIGKFTFNYG